MMQYRALRAGLLTLLAITGSLAASQANAAGVCDRGYISEIVLSAQDTATKAPTSSSVRVLYRVDSAGFTPPYLQQNDYFRVQLNSKFYSELYIGSSDSATDYDGKLQMLLSAFMSRTPVRIFTFGATCSMGAKEMEIVACSAENSCEI